VNDFTVDILRRDDFVLLTDDIKCWIVEIRDIFLLEAHQNLTLVHFASGKLLIRRTLRHCERRLDPSIFFRANRSCIVNLSRVVKQPRLLKDERLILRLRDGQDVVFSRRQGILFCKTQGLCDSDDPWDWRPRLKTPE